MVNRKWFWTQPRTLEPKTIHPSLTVLFPPVFSSLWRYNGLRGCCIAATISDVLAVTILKLPYSRACACRQEIYLKSSLFSSRTSQPALKHNKKLLLFEGSTCGRAPISDVTAGVSNQAIKWGRLLGSQDSKQQQQQQSWSCGLRASVLMHNSIFHIRPGATTLTNAKMNGHFTEAI